MEEIQRVGGEEEREEGKETRVGGNGVHSGTDSVTYEH